MKYLVGALAALILVIAAALAVIYSGMINVAASSGHSRLTRWVLDTSVHRSVKAHAGSTAIPGLEQQARIERGAHHFMERFAGCHGAPGVEPGRMSRALLPKPPELDESAREWNASQLHWIIAALDRQHGIKMTAMPAWGEIMKEDEIGDVVASLQRLPKLSPAEYEQLAEAGKH